MPAQAKLYQLVTFATDLQRGTPAFVVSGVDDASDRTLATVCDFLHADVGDPQAGSWLAKAAKLGDSRAPRPRSRRQ